MPDVSSSPVPINAERLQMLMETLSTLAAAPMAR